MKPLLSAATAAIVGFTPFVAMPASAQSHAGHMMVTPSDLKWSNVPSLPPGAQIATIEGSMSEAKPFTVRLKLPADYQVPAHSHPAVERVTVLSGTFNMGVGDKIDRTQTRALAAGSMAIMQPGTTHFVWTGEETIVQLHGIGPWGVTYANPADDPRKQ